MQAEWRKFENNFMPSGYAFRRYTAVQIHVPVLYGVVECGRLGADRRREREIQAKLSDFVDNQLVGVAYRGLFKKKVWLTHCC